MTDPFPVGARVRLPGQSQFSIVAGAFKQSADWRFFLQNQNGDIGQYDVAEGDASAIEVLRSDAGADAARVLAGFWCGWMRAATANARATALESSPLKPYAHQAMAVYDQMLPQPCLRFLLADEPGTGKTIMAGLYLREMQRLGLISRALIVAPAHLVSKWQADFERFFGGGLRRITGAAIGEGVLELPHDLWIVSLELAAQNPLVQEAIRPDRAGWQAVVIDEAHRMTPSARSLYRLGKLLTGSTPRALLMTATPHRGKDELFRSLMHLVDPQIYAEPSGASGERLFRPGRLHFLRRMKEDLLDYDGQTPLFKGRTATNESVALNAVEAAFYNESQELVARYFPPMAQTLARMVYGKRAASSLWALKETLLRRKKLMGSALPTAAAQEVDPDGEDLEAGYEASVVYEQSQSMAAEKSELTELLNRLEKTLSTPDYCASKWPRLVDSCLAANGIAPGNREQAVIFTEFTDSTTWLIGQLRRAGFSAERYSGSENSIKRDDIRARFARREFQVLVSTDAGNEGIDLQTAHVLVNWDIPWSLVRLEQRMGRIHRVGQTRDVQLYNLIALGTREGDVLKVLLGNFVIAANRLGGKVFDSLSAVAERMNLDWSELLSQTFNNESAQAIHKAQAADADAVEQTWKQAQQEEAALKSKVNVVAALGQLQQETLESINPRIVEAFGRHLAGAKICKFSPYSLGEGTFQLTISNGKLPFSLGGKRSATVATSGGALLEARAASPNSDIIAIGPSQQAFRDLVAQMDTELRADLFRGAVLSDSTGETPYQLLLWEMSVSENGAPNAAWPVLVRVDAEGARVVRWESLANIVTAPTMTNPQPLDETQRESAASVATQARVDRLATRAEALDVWLKDAQSEFARLEQAQLDGLKRDERIEKRKQLKVAINERLEEFRRATRIEIGEPHFLGWARVEAGALPIDSSKVNSENIAMQHVRALLQGEGWIVEDVHLENRGYDLYASKGTLWRCVEVKGVWEGAASQGINLTGNEVLIASQQAQNYWLYVVEQCQNGKGQLFAAWSDPMAQFQNSMKDISLVKIAGSQLSAARASGKFDAKDNTYL